MGSEVIKVLVVSENKVLLRNLYEWFHYRIDGKTLQIDHARNKEEAVEKMKEEKYNKIFHNGIYIIDVIEKLQIGAEVWNYDHTNNKYGNVIDATNQRAIKNIMKNKKYIFDPNKIYSGLMIFFVLMFMFTMWKINRSLESYVKSFEPIKKEMVYFNSKTDSLIVAQGKIVVILDKLINKVEDISKKN